MKQTIYFFCLLALLAMSCALPTTLTADNSGANMAQTTPQTATGTPMGDAPTMYAVSADKLNLRACGGTSCDLVSVLTRGTKLQFTGYAVTSWDKSEWWQVQTAKQTGWVNSRYIEVAK